MKGSKVCTVNNFQLEVGKEIGKSKGEELEINSHLKMTK